MASADQPFSHAISTEAEASAASLACRALPIGLAGSVTLRNDIAAGAVLTYEDVGIDEGAAAVRLRRQLESAALARSHP